MGEFLSYAVPGVPVGCTFAIMAVGLVLTYRATGVFNFAFGAQAYVAAFVYAELDGPRPQKWSAFLLAVVVMSPLLGLAFDRLIFRHIASANGPARSSRPSACWSPSPSCCRSSSGRRRPRPRRACGWTRPPSTSTSGPPR